MLNILRKKKARKVEIRREEVVDSSLLNTEVVRVKNLIEYTKTKGASYSAIKYTDGYHSMELKGHTFIGQRNPGMRLAKVPIDFAGLTVLDIGCNQGGMLFEIAGQVRHGIGIDYDPKMINVANRIKSASDHLNLDFYVFDLENEPLAYIKDFLKDDKVDVVFLLSVCKWIQNCDNVMSFLQSISHSMVFESNGKPLVQKSQVQYLNSIYKHVDLISESSDDDPLTKGRKLYFCK